MGQKLLKGQKYVKKWSKMGQISPEIFHRWVKMPNNGRNNPG